MFMFVVFFFFKQKTAYEMRISDWSSDVCSSDLFAAGERGRGIAGCRSRRWAGRFGDQRVVGGRGHSGASRPDGPAHVDRRGCCSGRDRSADRSLGTTATALILL